MYGKYTLFYESPKNWGYDTHAQTVCTRPLLKGEGPGDKAKGNWCFIPACRDHFTKFSVFRHTSRKLVR